MPSRWACPLWQSEMLYRSRAGRASVTSARSMRWQAFPAKWLAPQARLETCNSQTTVAGSPFPLKPNHPVPRYQATLIGQQALLHRACFFAQDFRKAGRNNTALHMKRFLQVVSANKIRKTFATIG